MQGNQKGPFKRDLKTTKRRFSIHSSWVGAALILIAITQIPLALKSSIEILEIVGLKSRQANEDCICKKY